MGNFKHSLGGTTNFVKVFNPMKIEDNFKPDISTKKKREIIERAYYFALSFKEKRMCTREKFKEKFGNNTRNLFKWSMKYLYYLPSLNYH